MSSALARDRLGAPGIGLSIASSIAPLTVVAGVVTTGLAVTGLSGVSIAMVAVALTLIIFAVGYVAMARHITNAGAFYAYIALGISRPLGVGSAWVALVAYNCFQFASYGGLGVIAAPLLKQSAGLDLPWWGLALVAWLITALLGIRDVGVSEKVLAVLVISETVLVLVYSVVILFSDGFSPSLAPVSPSSLWGPGAGALLVIAATGFAGVEQGAVYIEESRDPKRTVARATFVTIVLIAVLYAFASWVQISAAGDQAVDRARAEGPEMFFNLASGSLGGNAVQIGETLFVTSLLAAMIAFHNIISRYMFALGREGVFPRVLGRATADGAPRNASLVQSVCGLMVIILFAAADWDPLVQLFFWGGSTGGLGVLLLITATSVAVLGYFGRGARGENLWRRAIAPAIASVLLLVISYLAVTNLDALFGVDPGTGPAFVVPLLLLAMLVIGTVWGLVLRVTNRTVYDGIGLGPRAAAASATGFSALLDDEEGRR
ncbi:APC family permease [Micromonospora zhanjiangensis]